VRSRYRRTNYTWCGATTAETSRGVQQQFFQTFVTYLSPHWRAGHASRPQFSTKNSGSFIKIEEESSLPSCKFPENSQFFPELIFLSRGTELSQQMTINYLVVFQIPRSPLAAPQKSIDFRRLALGQARGTDIVQVSLLIHSSRQTTPSLLRIHSRQELGELSDAISRPAHRHRLALPTCLLLGTVSLLSQALQLYKLR
jgi:hypothetical protein